MQSVFRTPSARRYCSLRETFKLVYAENVFRQEKKTHGSIAPAENVKYDWEIQKNSYRQRRTIIITHRK